MGAILDTVLRFLHEDGWHPEQMGQQPIFGGRIEADNGSWEYVVQVWEDVHQVIFYSRLPREDNVPPERRLAVAEYMCRANCGLGIGNFELDFTDGQVRFRTSLDLEDGQLTPAMIRTLAYINVSVVNHHLPGLRQVIWEGVAPEQAIANVQAHATD